MNTNLKKLIRYLSDGKFHSGAHLGKTLAMTRSGIWKLIQQFADLGIEVESVTGKGYRIHGGLSLLNLQRIKSYITKNNLKKIKKIKIFAQIDSTNNYLIKQIKTSSITKHNGINICLAEQQTKGKGRLGRQWISPFGANIYLSMLYSFARDTSDLAGLSLVVATVVADVLMNLGIKNVGLKWPNDILWQNRKLAGVLIESLGEAYGISNTVIGIGLNVNMPATSGKLIDQPWVDLRSITKRLTDRNQIIGLLINQLIDKLILFQQKGMAAFMQKWQQLDVYIDKSVWVNTPTSKVYGIARGIDEHGYLRLEDKTGKIQVFSSGEVSLRK